MQFIPLNNFTALNSVICGTATNVTLKDISGTSRSIYGDLRNAPFYGAYSGTQTDPQNVALFEAVPDADIAHDYYSVSNQIGTTSQVTTRTSTGWNCVITITGSETATIKHLVAVKKFLYTTSNNSQACIFALKLDTPVELNAENNYTANFTFAIEF